MKKIILILCLLIIIPGMAFADDFNLGQNHQPFPTDIKAFLDNLVGKDVWADYRITKVKINSSLNNLEHLVITNIDTQSGTVKFTRDNGEIIVFQPLLVRLDRNKTDVNNYDSHIASDLNSSFYLQNPYEKHPDWSNEIWEQIKAQKVSIGMSREMCLLSWGYPNWQAVRKIVDVTGLHETWSYSPTQHLYFTNGLLTSIEVTE